MGGASKKRKNAGKKHEKKWALDMRTRKRNHEILSKEARMEDF